MSMQWVMGRYEFNDDHLVEHNIELLYDYPLIIDVLGVSITLGI